MFVESCTFQQKEQQLVFTFQLHLTTHKYEKSHGRLLWV